MSEISECLDNSGVELRMDNKTDIRTAWLLPSMEGGNYWHPLFSEFTRIMPQTTVYTSCWSGFTSGFENSFNCKVIGKMKLVGKTKTGEGYSGFMLVSPAIIRHLLQFKPDVIFTSYFSIWTLLAVLLKPLTNWKVIIFLDGISPSLVYQHSPIRLLSRRLMVKLADCFISNNEAAKTYLVKVLGAKITDVFTRPYQVPTSKAMKTTAENIELINQQVQQPVFLFVGQLIPRKGLPFLLEACKTLQQWGYSKYTLMIIGKGSDREELESLSRNYGLEESVKWIGWIDYSRIGDYFKFADVFILPALEDVWGMVVLESMAFGKPVLCSKWAGASELVIDGENGYVFDPHKPEYLAQLMKQFIDNPYLSTSMGSRAKQLISEHTPEAAATFLSEIVEMIAYNKPRVSKLNNGSAI